MKRLTLEWERRVAGLEAWDLIKMYIPVGITVFEVQCMAAGLRAESRNIRDVRVKETSEVARYLT